jgi:phospholipase/carboxylesterase
MELLPCIEIETADHPTAAVIWLHGLGADGGDFASLLPQLDLAGCPGIRFIFPSAPSMPVTVNGGYVMPAWYDIIGRSSNDKEDESGIERSAKAIEALIERECSRGIAQQNCLGRIFSRLCDGLAHRAALPASLGWHHGLIRLLAPQRLVY